MEFEGQQNLHVLEANIPCPPGLINSSSNPNYNALAPNNNDNDLAEEFVYISGLNLHDNNMNIIGKANMAQPIVKREHDKFLFRIRIDF